MSVRPGRVADPDRREFELLPFHSWHGCRGCGAVVFDWAVHRQVCHEHAPEEAPEAAVDLVARARAEGAAVVEFGAWRQAWRQVRDVLRLRPVQDPRPAAAGAAIPPGAVLPPETAAGRAATWARIDGLITKTTGSAG